MNVTNRNLSSSEDPTSGQVLARSATLGVIGAAAISGNLLVLATIGRYRKLRTAVNVFVGNLALINLVMGILQLSMLPNVIQNRNTLGSRGCSAWGMVAGIMSTASTFTMALIAFSRYWIITHAHSFSRVFALRKCCLMSLVTWLVGVVLNSGMVLGWSRASYNRLTRACSFDRDDGAGRSFSYFIIVTTFAVPLGVVVICYVLLFYTVYKSQRKVKAMKTNPRGPVSTSTSPSPNTSRSTKLTRMLITICLIYVFCLGPYSFTNIADSDGARTSETWHVVVTWFLFTNAAINPVIYGLMNDHFRDGYRDLLGCTRCCQNEEGVSGVDRKMSVEELDMHVTEI